MHQHFFVRLRQNPKRARILNVGHLLVHVHVRGPQICSIESLRTVADVQGFPGTVHYRNSAGVDFHGSTRLHLLSLLKKPKVCADHQGKLLINVHERFCNRILWYINSKIYLPVIKIYGSF